MDYKGKRIVCIDFETFFDRKISYDLKSLSIAEYVRDERFLVWGMAYKFTDDAEAHWLVGDHAVSAWVSSVDWPNTVAVAHNAKFDLAILAWRFGVKAFANMDTMGLAKAVIGGNISSHSLKRLAEYLGFPAKGEVSCEGIRFPSHEQLVTLGAYCKNDTTLCEAIYEKLISQFPQSQLSAMDWTIRVFVEPSLMLNMRELEEGVKNEKTRREEIIKKSGVEKDVLSSNKQFAEYLSSKGLHVPTKLSSRTGRAIPAFARTDAGLGELATTAPDLYAARIASKSNLLETRGESLLAVAKTGSFPFDVGFSGAVQTHRYSGGSGAGGNPQNFTRNSFLRSAVCSPSGYSLVVGDFAAIELRLLAWLAKEPRLMGKIINEEDIYADFASLKYGRKITKADKVERQFGKCSILGLGYNMGAKKFKLTVKNQTGTEISEDDAWKTVDLYRTTYFNVPKLWEQAHALLPLISSGAIGCIWFAPFLKVKKGSIILPSGLQIRYPNLRPRMVAVGSNGQYKEEWVYDTYKKVYEAETTNLYGGKIIENICQALAGELCKEAIERAETAGLRCIGQVHDEIIAIVRQDTLRGEAEKEAIAVLQNCMQHPPKWMPTLKLKAEIGYGRSWANAKI